MKKLFAFFLILSSLQSYSQDDYVFDMPAEDKQEVKAKTYTEFPNPDYTDYTITQTSFTLKKRDFRIADTDIIFAKGSYGLTDKLTASLNISLIGTFFATLKHKFEINDDVTFAVSASGGNALQLTEDSIISFAGAGTFITLGDIQNNFTFGASLYFAESTFDVAGNLRKLYFHNVSVGLQRQLKRKTYIIAEGMYFWNYNTFLGSIALKFVIKKHMSLHIGVMPLYRSGRLHNNQTRGAGGVAPIISYRWLLDRN